MSIEVIHAPKDEILENLEVSHWPIWEKEVSQFDWTYDEKETCYLLEGEVEVSTPEGLTVCFGKGDLVSFPQGLNCQWTIKAPVKKHYRFG